MNKDIISIFETATAIVESNKDYYDKIQENWNKTIINRKQIEDKVIKKYNDDRSGDILDFL